MPIKIYAIPGTFCNENVWKELIKTLPIGFELININIPLKSSISEIIDSLEKQLPKEPSLLLGFSFGGYIISAFSLKYPQRVKKLLIISDLLDKLTDEESKGRKQFSSFIKSDGFSGVSKELVMSVLHPNKQKDTQLHNEIIQMSQSISVEVAQNQLLASITREDIIKKVGRLGIPTYIVIGDMDKTLNQVNKKIAQNNHIIQFEQITGSGHFLPLEQPKEMTKVLMNWLF
ncbi:MAG: alpha/beta hydrolase [Saccharospirillaceae bacterium]|nr:alpha/beta hydrolase [Pseudomonadales bacterium]NRB79463.1 alpha/beta hydrolase [Saccharospirillaceae bacterium]